jgi:hypothetical protein
MNITDIYRPHVLISYCDLNSMKTWSLFFLFSRYTHPRIIYLRLNHPSKVKAFLVILQWLLPSTLISSGVIVSCYFWWWFASLPFRVFRPNLGTRFFLGGEDVTVRVFVMLGIYFVSMKYVFVKCKACVCLCETFENLKVLIKRVFL